MAAGAVLFGLVLAPMGWVLLLAATAAPQWREMAQRPDYPWDISLSEGLWESCTETSILPSGRHRQCHPIRPEMAASWQMQLMRSLTMISLVGSLLSYFLANLGARWWSGSPSPRLTGTAGLGLVLCGAVYLGAVSYMAHSLLQSVDSPQAPKKDTFSLGTCLYLGWAGASAEILAGVAFSLSFHTPKRTRSREDPASLPAPGDVDY